jgi:hypothetical protein
VSFSPVFALSIHADYRCHRSGVCCSSDWDVPVEAPLYRSLQEAIASGRLKETPGAVHALLTGDDLPGDAAAMVARTGTGDCVFYHRPSGLCVVHRDLGEAQLPSTCRHFPRLAVRDARGTFISLTHYCPTAASALFRDDVDLRIIESPDAFPARDYDGLTIEPDAWPPLLHPRMLMDLAAYGAWERHMVTRCAGDDASPEDVLATLERDARLLRRHQPGNGTLADAVAALPRLFVQARAHSTLAASLAFHREALQAIPDELMPDADEEMLPEAFATRVGPRWPHWERPLKRYLAAKAFASWTAYQGRGVLTVVRGIEAALALVRVEAARQCRDRGRSLDRDLLREAFRQVDFILNHLAVGEELASRWSRVEEE